MYGSTIEVYMPNFQKKSRRIKFDIFDDIGEKVKKMKKNNTEQ